MKLKSIKKFKKKKVEIYLINETKKQQKIKKITGIIKKTKNKNNNSFFTLETNIGKEKIKIRVSTASPKIIWFKKY